MSASLPIACSLSREALEDRLAWIGGVNRDFLRTYALHRTTLRLAYDIDAERDLRVLVESERKCCNFLRFAIRESADAIELHIEAPDLDVMNIESLFAPFLGGAR